ncbi:hypothetical protein ACQ4LE_001816 [Meloidogyne hapla]
MANNSSTSTDLETEKRRKLLIMQNALFGRARKRRVINETDNNQQQCSSASSINSKDDEICVVYHKKDVKKKEDEEVLFIGENKIEKSKGDEALRGMATQALIREANRSAQRAMEYGPQGWLKPRALTTNKRFLARTLQSVELDRREHEQRRKMAMEKRRAKQ